MKSKNREFWDGVYSGGKEYIDLTHEQISIVFDDTIAGSRILDIGCGSGKLMQLAEERGLVACGIEVSEVAIAKARQRGVKGEIVLLDTEEIDEYEDKNRYNKIVLKLVIAFVKNKINLFSWIKEHLKEGGELIIITPTISRTNQFKILGISINQNELEQSLNLVFGGFEIKNVMETPNGRIYTFVCKK